jgi:hypothetical protein
MSWVKSCNMAVTNLFFLCELQEDVSGLQYTEMADTPGLEVSQRSQCEAGLVLRLFSLGLDGRRSSSEG